MKTRNDIIKQYEDVIRFSIGEHKRQLGDSNGCYSISKGLPTIRLKPNFTYDTLVHEICHGYISQLQQTNKKLYDAIFELAQVPANTSIWNEDSPVEAIDDAMNLVFEAPESYGGLGRIGVFEEGFCIRVGECAESISKGLKVDIVDGFDTHALRVATMIIDGEFGATKQELIDGWEFHTSTCYDWNVDENLKIHKFEQYATGGFEVYADITVQTACEAYDGVDKFATYRFCVAGDANGHYANGIELLIDGKASNDTWARLMEEGNMDEDEIYDSEEHQAHYCWDEDSKHQIDWIEQFYASKLGNYWRTQV